MNIASVQTKEFHRRLSTPMKTSRGLVESRSGIILAINGVNNAVGYGEVDFPLYRDVPDYDQEVASIRRMLSATLDAINGLPVPSSLDDITAGLKPLMPASHPGVYFGVETALCDLAAGVVGQPLHRWFRWRSQSSVPVNYLIPRPVDDWDRIECIVREGGYGAVKAKVGGRSLEEDVEFVSRLRETLGGTIAIRLDANRAWDVDTALAACTRLNKFDIEYIEEPLADFDINRLTLISKKTGIRFALDESLMQVNSIHDAMTSPVRPALILKPARIGGVANTMSIVKRAGKHGCPAVITSNLETEIGTAALLHAAAASYDNPPSCGLDTMRMFANPNPALTDVEDGKLKAPPGMGIGVGDSVWKSL